MKNRKGFTIVELVIVIAVIAILAAVLIPTFATVIAKANQSNATQTATNALKAGLLMTNTAQLPADTLIVVDSDKNPTSKPDFGFTYANGNEVKEYDIYKGEGGAFAYTQISTVGTILIGDVISSTTGEGESATTTYTLDPVVQGILKTVTSGATTVTVEKNADDSYKITVDTTVYKAFTSVDMPKNTVIFVTGTKEVNP